MPLDDYKKKRAFNKTPEPAGGKPAGDKLRFVVQKHAASHLHYDFRLEVKGVLKSWAVPKGPSMNPADKRLAMPTEDHPYDYISFEGIIPKGQYGGGTVIIWDEGTFTTPVVKEKNKKAQEHSLMQQYFKGEMLVELKGHKLKGKFALIRKSKDAGDNERDTWFLLKVKDKYATGADITAKDKSVVSNLTIAQMAENPKAGKWQSNRTRISESANEPSAITTGKNETKAIYSKGKKAPVPAQPQPMNATLVKKPFTHPDWLYEVKLDGYRILVKKQGNKVRLFTRGGMDYSKYYPTVVEALKEIDEDVVLDGEIVVVDDKGMPSFDLLQKYNGEMAVIYYGFDILWVAGYDLTELPLYQRKELLQQLLPQSEIVRYSEDFDDGRALFEKITTMGLEGIVAKRRDSIYQPGKRTKDWLKLLTTIKQEFVIGGWTESESGRDFRSILFGAYDKGQLKFVGHSGSGFSDKVMKEIMNRLKPLEIKKKPFAGDVDHNTTPHWVKPALVANFKFATWTAGGKIRKPAIFLGFRNDKDPKDVLFEIPLSTKEEQAVINEHKPRSATTTKTKATKKPIALSTDSNWPLLDKQPITSSEVFEIDGKDLTLTNVEKQLWPGITRAHLIQYYHAVAPYLLPHLAYRPQSLHIKHTRPTAPGMYIKDMEGRQPEWASIFTVERKHRKPTKRNMIDYLVCNNEATLLYMVNLGCIDINPWTSQVHDYLHPNYIIIDLDPSDDDFGKVIETARAAKQYLDKQRIKAFAKTSGKTGMHLYLPCSGFTFAEARKIAEHICQEIHLLVPAITTTEVTIARRGNRLYIDPSQNDEADTVAAPYSVRPFHHPSVSAPLEWREVNNKLNPLSFDIHSLHKRLAKKGDLFKGVLDINTAHANNPILHKLLR